MIYGINFNGTRIPEQALAVLPTKVKVKGVRFELKGACETKDELDAMLITANNGHRALHSEHSGDWYGVYTNQ
jgi:hypothetical protein